ncbi:hypothetical protein B0A75_09725 [Flavobacterium oncorhynchi]|uniref:Uncharacterized protein n=1 Tax=Flavobacterium oncorhynchi TaxID=728056 RepID=A0A226I045_9FLAO|nr:hypothetical protein [Flavobacterium oncorhynchi]OXA99794.1 hypothetical protein B0A75_09725 [Flavobacterium oncorhynchi]
MKKISLKNIKETLTRAEMRAINGGSSGDEGPICKSSRCELYVRDLGKKLDGTCKTFEVPIGPGSVQWTCKCEAGGYHSDDYGTACIWTPF